jgi:hypothetical protein
MLAERKCFSNFRGPRPTMIENNGAKGKFMKRTAQSTIHQSNNNLLMKGYGMQDVSTLPLGGAFLCLRFFSDSRCLDGDNSARE